MIDAEVGVYKDFDGIDPVYGMRHLTVHHIIEGDQYIFMDNNELEMPMIEGSYQFETDLEIFISVNESNA